MKQSGYGFPPSLGRSALVVLLGLATVVGANASPRADGPARMRIELIDQARNMMGTPYVWGGVTPDGFDCSGLVQYSFYQIGVEVPRTAALQVEASQPVSIDSLRPGDLLFFDTTDRYSHVGIYVGNGRFIHAPRTGRDVSISTLHSPYWNDALSRAGSFLN
ncbi:MAG: C40 family peptidase [Gammaproteobacteria bacterium]|nr:C40 family peptidase [Gammaproteobacteria bacterium]MBA3732221.1 C40 family peptidase [Gammaproteobacteria bacterium]